MRVFTVSELKGGRRGSGGRRDYPAEGSVGWKIWKRLDEFHGHTVDLTEIYREAGGANFIAAISSLTDMYGLDIRRTGRRRGAPYTFVLAGEWLGAHYSDYCAQAFKEGGG